MSDTMVPAKLYTPSDAMAISHTVDQTIHRRHAQMLPLLKECKALSDRLPAHIKRLTDMCETMLKSGDIQTDAEEYSRLLETIQKLNEYRETLATKLSTFEHLLARCGRSTLNIAVFGGARQGKSTLLQTLTGLDNAVIPTGKQAALTGVQCNVHHDGTKKKGEVDATVHFYSQESLLALLNQYWEPLHEAMPHLVPINRLSQIDELARIIIPSLSEDDRQDVSAPLVRHLSILKLYKNHLPQFKAHLEPVEPKTLKVPKAQIRDFIEIPGVNDARTPWHLIVDRVEIFTPFDVTEMSDFVLVDLPGADDVLGHRERIQKAMGEEIDAAFCLIKPGSQGWEINLDEAYDRANRLLRHYLPLKEWAFLIINHSKVKGDNLDQCRMMLAEIKNRQRDRQYEFAANLIADVTDLSELETTLLPTVLNHLKQNIVELDKQFALKYADELNTLHTKLQNDLRDLQYLLGPISDQNLRVAERRERRKRFHEMLYQLECLKCELEAESLGKSVELQQVLEDAIAKFTTSWRLDDPEVFDRRAKILGDDLAALAALRTAARAQIVTCLSTMDADMEAYLNRIRDRVIQALRAGGLHNLLPEQNGLPKLISLLEGTSIQEAFLYLMDCRFSISSLSLYNVRAALRPLEREANAGMVPGGPDGTLETEIHPPQDGMMLEQLRNTVQHVMNSVRTSLDKEMRRPSQFAYAMVAYVIDAAFRNVYDDQTPAYDEWDAFIERHYIDIISDEAFKRERRVNEWRRTWENEVAFGIDLLNQISLPMAFG